MSPVAYVCKYIIVSVGYIITIIIVMLIVMIK